jgi:hypothetical protein
MLGEQWRNREVARRLSPAMEDRWDELGSFGRWQLRRRIRRGRTFDARWDAVLAAEAAAALRGELRRWWALALFVAFGAAALLLAVVLIADHQALPGVVLAVAGISLLIEPLTQRRLRRRLVATEKANRAIAARYEG